MPTDNRGSEVAPTPMPSRSPEDCATPTVRSGADVGPKLTPSKAEVAPISTPTCAADVTTPAAEVTPPKRPPLPLSEGDAPELPPTTGARALPAALPTPPTAFPMPPRRPPSAFEAAVYIPRLSPHLE